MTSKTILDIWGISAAELTDVVSTNPSLRGMLVGYIAEKKLREFFEKSGITTDHYKDDDHARDKKGDLVLTYKGEEFRIEVKSLQFNSIQIQKTDGSWIPLVSKTFVGRKPTDEKKKNGDPKLGSKIYKWSPNPDALKLTREERLAANYTGEFQCDASDRRKIRLQDGTEVNTTLLEIGEFDIVAAGLFGFREQWEFGYALNAELPRSKDSRYSADVQKQLISSLIPVTLPLSPPFVSDPFQLLDRLLSRRRHKHK